MKSPARFAAGLPSITSGWIKASHSSGCRTFAGVMHFVARRPSVRHRTFRQCLFAAHSFGCGLEYSHRKIGRRERLTVAAKRQHRSLEGAAHHIELFVCEVRHRCASFVPVVAVNEC
jgi:hypothetical protein